MGLFGKKNNNDSSKSETPLFENKYAGSKTRVFPTHIEWSLLGQHESIPLSQVANIQIPAMVFEAVIETTGGKQIRVPMSDKKGFKAAVIRAMNTASPNNSTINNEPSKADELKKFSQLKDDGIITEEEFQAKKQELLGL